MWKRSKEDERRLQKMAEYKNGFVFAGAYMHPHGYLKRYTYGDKEKKKLCNRIARRKLKKSNDLLQGNLYRKISEYEWWCW